MDFNSSIALWTKLKTYAQHARGNESTIMAARL